VTDTISIVAIAVDGCSDCRRNRSLRPEVCTRGNRRDNLFVSLLQATNSPY